MYFSIKYLAIGPPSIPPKISPNVAAAIPTLVASYIPKFSIVAPNAAAQPCPPSIEIVPHISPSNG